MSALEFTSLRFPRFAVDRSEDGFLFILPTGGKVTPKERAAVMRAAKEAECTATWSAKNRYWYIQYG